MILPLVTDVCTLPTAEQPLRIAEWDRLFADAAQVTRQSPVSATVDLPPDPHIASRAADLAVRETRCCSFFTFTVTASGGRVQLGITVPEAHVAVLTSLTSRIGSADLELA